MDPAFVGVPEAARSVVVSRANDLPADVWNSEAQEQLARIYQAAHDATVILQTMATTSGVPVISATLGSGQRDVRRPAPASGRATRQDRVGAPPQAADGRHGRVASRWHLKHPPVPSFDPSARPRDDGRMARVSIKTIKKLGRAANAYATLAAGGGPTARIGVLESQGGGEDVGGSITLATLALILTLGTRTIPGRPFLGAGDRIRPRPGVGRLEARSRAGR